MNINELQHVLNRIHPYYSKGIGCGAGWFRIIFDCDRELAAIYPDYRVLQIKEKFGSLRYYFEHSDIANLDAMRDVVFEYERKSLRVCELTGKDGVLMVKNGRIRTLNASIGNSDGYLLF